MGRRRLWIALALLAPAVASHPVPGGGALAIEARLVDATDARTHHYFDQNLDPLSLGSVEPALTNRSYLVEVEASLEGEPFEGRISILFNNTMRHADAVAGVARFPVGHVRANFFSVQARAQAANGSEDDWVRFEWLVRESEGPMEPEPVERWGYAALPEWRTYSFTVETAGFAKITMGWDGIENGTGGFLAALDYRLPSGETDSFFAWMAYDGAHAARVAAHASLVEARASVGSPVSLTTAPAAIAAMGEWPAGAVINVTQGVLKPNDAGRFFVAAEADPGVLALDVPRSGVMRAYGRDDFRGGTELTATVAGFGEVQRLRREADFVLAEDGLVLIEADVGRSLGTYAWRFAGEEERRTLTATPWFWMSQGECAGPWWMFVDVGANMDESFALLHLAGYRLPEAASGRFTHAIGGSGCMLSRP